ncbi:hypothetical protein ACHAXT_011257 [Thalassiosira profunda]
MGAAQSSEPPSDAPTDDLHPSHCGFSPEEARRLLSLRRAMLRDLQERPEECQLRSIWKRSRGGERCGRLDRLLDEFSSLRRLNASLEKLFGEEEVRFLEKTSNVLGMHGHRQRDALDFVCNASCSGNGGSVTARDAVELCFQAASIVHYLLQKDAVVDDGGGEQAELSEARDVSAEESMIQSMVNSLHEHAKSSRDNQCFAGYSSPSTSTEAATIAEGEVTAAEFSEWQRKVVPDLSYCSVTRFLRLLFFPLNDCPSQSQVKPFPVARSAKEITSSRKKEGETVPILSHIFGENTASADNPTATTLLSPPMFAFASISSKFGENWYRIFAGADDGWTFQSLEHSILGYEGPTLLIMQAHCKHNNDEAVALGAYTASKWEKNKRDFFGTPDCFLFQLQPTLRVLRPLPKMGTRGGHYMYFHSNTNVVTSNPARKDDLAVGLGFGGTVRHPRLFIDSHLEECRVSHKDTSFEEGYLGFPPSNDPFASQSFSSTLHIDSLEIYAVGDDETINRGFKAQTQHRDIADATLRNARTVDKVAFLGDMRNGVIETKAFAHRGQVDGRAHGALKGEDDGKANGL